VPHGGRRRSGEGPGFGDVGQQGTDVTALGCSDISGRHTPHGCGRRGSDRGVRRGTTTQVRAADRQGVMTRRRALTGGPQPQCQAAALADRRAQRHSAGRRGFKLDSKIFQTDSKFSKL
jgi:hypothetical protein